MKRGGQKHDSKDNLTPVNAFWKDTFCSFNKVSKEFASQPIYYDKLKNCSAFYNFSSHTRNDTAQGFCEPLS